VSTTRAFFFAMAGVQSIYDFVVKVLENLFTLLLLQKGCFRLAIFLLSRILVSDWVMAN
jgi:hypothetical protein